MSIAYIGTLCLLIALSVCLVRHCLAKDKAEIALESNGNSIAQTINSSEEIIDQAVTSNHSCYRLQAEDGRAVYPGSVIKADGELYFLGPQCLWSCLGVKTSKDSLDALVLKRIDPPAAQELGIPCQEFSDFIYLPKKHALAILDKSGDLFEYKLGEPHKPWHVLRANNSKLGAPDPDYVAITEINDSVVLLDPERNQIWYQQDNSPNLQGLLPGVLAWKLHAGDANITDGIAITFNKGKVYLLRRNGNLNKYAFKQNLTKTLISEGALYFKKPVKLRPSRLYAGEENDLYIVERENNRVLRVFTQKDESKAFIFPAGCNLRGLTVAGDGFWIINGNYLSFKGRDDEKALSAKFYPRTLDKRLASLIMPIDGQHLPGHPGVYPGARRLYRFGVHNGLDLFNQSGSKQAIVIGTSVRAACAGQIVRLDSSYKDMNLAVYNRVIKNCWRTHHTSEQDEDLLRGCQVWIDSHNGLLTKYAHLSHVNNKLHVGEQVKQGDVIGYVGISGTGENLPGHTPAPHLHFEIWLNGKYVGWARTPAETISLFEDIFAAKK